MSSILIDTNLLLDDPTVIFKLTLEYDKIVIPITVLKELDKHKFNPDLSYSARQAINAILSPLMVMNFWNRYGWHCRNHGQLYIFIENFVRDDSCT